MVDSDDYAENWSMQVDELVALHAIYEENFRFFGGEGVAATTVTELEECGCAPPEQPTSLTCVAMIHPQLSEGHITVRLAAPSTQDEPEASSSSSTTSSAPAGSSSSYEVVLKHLPPISVHLQLPPTYPSAAPPRVHLAAEWLLESQLDDLGAHLQAAWCEAGAGGPICFTWLDWLQCEALAALGAERTLELRGNGMSTTVATSTSAGRMPSDVALPSSRQPSTDTAVAGPSGSGSGSRPEEVDGGLPGGVHDAEHMLGMLLRFNATRTASIFRQGLHTCGICFEEKPGTQFLILPGCGHSFCGSCLPAMCKLHVQEGDINALRCPEAKCGHPFSITLLERVLTKEEFQRWDDLVLKRTLDTMEDVVYCPKCSTPTLEQADHFAQCPKCFHPFCSLCNEHWHSNECMSAEDRVRLLQERSAALRQRQGEDIVKKQRELHQEIETIKLLKTTSKSCPTCGMGITKTEGCNKVVCSNCFNIMCYVCGKAIKGYDHFGEKGCVLFSQDEIDRWNNMGFVAELPQGNVGLNAGDLERFGGGMLGWAGAYVPSLCPCCGQMNLKIANNNHMRCWSCSSHYCHLCRKVLVGKGSGAKHFGPSKCKQHSAG